LRSTARIAYLSRFYFNRVFREVTGLPPVRFHTALRIAAAKRLLMTTDLSVTEVCLEVGYQSLGTFTTHFHELVGVSPRELRRAAPMTASVPARLADALARSQTGSGTPAVEGELLGAPDGEPAFVGLFRQPYPHGVPFACAVLDGPGRYSLQADARGSFHVAATAFGADDRPALVAVTHRPVRLAPGRTSRRDLRLRPVRRTDPPILLALPRLSPAGNGGPDSVLDQVARAVAE
jgi:AraC family transcriptional regulator